MIAAVSLGAFEEYRAQAAEGTQHDATSAW